MSGSERQSVMVVDDTPESLRLLCTMLDQRGYRVRAFPGGEWALRSAAAEVPDLVLLDVDMPGLDGFEVCRRLRLLPGLHDVPVIFVSAHDDTASKLRAFEAGGMDYLTKPVRFEEVDARVRTHLALRAMRHQLEAHNRDLEARVAAAVREVSDAQMATIFALAKLAESRDDDTGLHIVRVSRYAARLAEAWRELGGAGEAIDGRFVANLREAAPLHDVGKVGIPDAVLLKPGRLDAAEFETVKTHALIGWRTLQAVLDRYPRNEFLRMGAEIARSHHERWDGSGYPDGLGGPAIPLSCRILAVADVYDALRSARPYKPPFEHGRAAAILREGAGSHFDPEAVGAFAAAADDLDRTRRELGDG